MIILLFIISITFLLHLRIIYQGNNWSRNMDPPDASYTEILYAHLLDCDGTRLTYTHFTTKVIFGTLVEITFNRPVYIQKHKVCLLQCKL